MQSNAKIYMLMILALCLAVFIQNVSSGNNVTRILGDTDTSIRNINTRIDRLTDKIEGE